MFGTTEILLIVLAIIILFGGKKLPEIARSIGKGYNMLKRELREFRNGMNAEENDDEPEMKG